MNNNIKYFLGPMSKNVVDSVIRYNNKNGLTFGFIPSRRQVEYNGGYVNNWKNETFSQYVKGKSPDTIIERDHGGPGQGYKKDDGKRSFKSDSKYFDLIHIDPWKEYPKLIDGIRHTVDIIKYCLNINPEIEFEVGTEEAIRRFEMAEIETLLSSLKNDLSKSEFQKIKYMVVQSGVGLDLGKMKNTGTYDKNRLKKMVDIAHHYNKLTKEHNGDYLTFHDINSRFNVGLDAINIAPELGQIETCSLIELFKDQDDIIEDMYQLCFNSNRWCKWVPKNYDPDKNKLELIKICGHYIFSEKKFALILKKLSNRSKIDLEDIYDIIQEKITFHLKYLIGG